MMKHEFEERINAEISDQDYKTVELVYTWHTAIPNVGGKDMIAQLYKIGGMAVINDMAKSASVRCANIMRMERVVQDVKEEMRSVEEKMEELDAEMRNLRMRWQELSSQYAYAKENLRVYSEQV